MRGKGAGKLLHLITWGRGGGQHDQKIDDVTPE